MVNPFLFGVALAFGLLLLTMAVVMIVIGRIGSAVIFFLMATAFLAVATGNGMTVSFQEEGVVRSLLGIRLSTLKWEEVREVGVCGNRPFHKKGSDRVGSHYLYFSREKMTEDQRFEMILKWPPRRQVYLLFSQERAAAAQIWWKHPLVFYNSGKLRIEERPLI